ncbi:hypothetical protein A3D88_02165 [Candidatus Peribacteria bacterium RIFCSPHIGHO2_02_FULL_52_16]|nr:MAG: hypothetical protein A2706_02780 [Candidatus Peribacteria bacterium RIFCSPHIGHO2_01_FULL_51_35]OGJ61429.1 MAG: hypothetical protein A3D88_02165 [Candidatus Peribacteria bacterium RIFCSPHIGHO2_02_FULL_52_16]
MKRSIASLAALGMLLPTLAVAAAPILFHVDLCDRTVKINGRAFLPFVQDSVLCDGEDDSFTLPFSVRRLCADKITVFDGDDDVTSQYTDLYCAPVE